MNVPSPEFTVSTKTEFRHDKWILAVHSYTIGLHKTYVCRLEGGILVPYRQTGYYCHFEEALAEAKVITQNLELGDAKS